jgi:hypothetical protein
MDELFCSNSGENNSFQCCNSDSPTLEEGYNIKFGSLWILSPNTENPVRLKFILKYLKLIIKDIILRFVCEL